MSYQIVVAAEACMLSFCSNGGTLQSNVGTELLHRVLAGLKQKLEAIRPGVISLYWCCSLTMSLAGDIFGEKWATRCSEGGHD